MAQNGVRGHGCSPLHFQQLSRRGFLQIGMLAGGLLIGNYLLFGLSNINEDLKTVMEYTPLHYYQGGQAIDGLEWGWIAGIVAAALVLALLAWWRFQGRDIRVGGEGGWTLPAWVRLFRRSARRAQEL